MSYLAKLRQMDHGNLAVSEPTIRYEINEINEKSSDAMRCLGCLCDNPIPRLNLRCPLCQSMTCAQCDQCTAYRRGWNPGWVDPTMVDQSLIELLDRLRIGQHWLQEKDREEYTGEAFGKMLAVWDEIEILIRHVHEFKDCIHDPDASCPEDAPVRCCACVPILLQDTRE